MVRPPEWPKKPKVAKFGLDHLNRQKMRRVRKMNNGRINKTGDATRDVPQILGEGICAHKTNRGEKSEDGRILSGKS